MSVAVSKAPVTFSLPIRQRLFGRTEWIAFGLVVGIVLAATPICSLAVPFSSPFYLSTYALTLVGKIMCYALVALSLDLVWGYCGVLSLGHGLFFALGGYAMGEGTAQAVGGDADRLRADALGADRLRRALFRGDRGEDVGRDRHDLRRGAVVDREALLAPAAADERGEHLLP